MQLQTGYASAMAARQRTQRNKGKKVAQKPAADFPNWKWRVTRAGNALSITWALGEQKRDQDFFECHYFNDFTYYGMLENIENAVQAAYNEYEKEKFDIERYWTQRQSGCTFIKLTR